MRRISDLRTFRLWDGLSLVLLCLFCLASLNAQAGELQSIRDEVRDPADRSFSLFGSKNDDDDHHSCSRDHRYGNDYFGDEDYDGGLSEFGAQLLGYAVISPFVIPRSALSDVGETGYFLKYPYHKGRSFMVFDDWYPQPRRFSGRIRLEYSENFRDLWEAGGQIQLETTSRLGIDTEAHRFEERLSRGRIDQLHLGDFNFTYRFAQSEKAVFRAGLGFNWLSDAVRSDYGFNFTYGFDLYPCRPWVFSTEFDLGTLGKSELFRFRTTAGIMIHRVETYIGYEYLNIANTTYNSLIAGLRVSF